MTAFYDEMAAMALEMLTEYGQQGRLVQVAPGEYNPATGRAGAGTERAQPAQVIARDFSGSGTQMLAAGTQMLVGDKEILIAAAGLSWAPTLTTALELGGAKWIFVNIKEVNPAGAPLLYRVHGRRA